VITAAGTSGAIEAVNTAPREDPSMTAENRGGTAAPTRLDRIEFTLNPMLLPALGVVSAIIRLTKGMLAE